MRLAKRVGLCVGAGALVAAAGFAGGRFSYRRPEAQVAAALEYVRAALEGRAPRLSSAPKKAKG